MSGTREVFLGFARADLLFQHSFADILNEDTGKGYQRPFNLKHSNDFRRYIQGEESSTIPLTFNLRPEAFERCRLISSKPPAARLVLPSKANRILAQVDCQHRLGHLADLAVSLPFMCYLGLTEREEMQVFNTINGKARGLGASLLDFHDATLARDLAGDRPELFISLLLQNDSSSPWFRQLDLGGTSTSGLHRRASLRTMQKATKRFLRQSSILDARTAGQAAEVVLAFWQAVEAVARELWLRPRNHLLTKGVGVYALMTIAADLFQELGAGETADKRYFVSHLAEFLCEVDWSTSGDLRGLGGESGVEAAVDVLRSARKRSRIRAVPNDR